MMLMGEWGTEQGKSVTLTVATGGLVKQSTHKGTTQWHDTSTDRTVGAA